ncbi:MAG: circadian clock protein KaiB [Trueperaceae bacterium]|nr:circadian clock protein KaiB [Trueperaceae bacterium]
MADAGDDHSVRLRLYVAGEGPNSRQARENLRVICEAHLAGRHVIEVLDVFEEPERALDDGVYLTPQLLVLVLPPATPRTVVGNLSEREVVLRALGVSDGVA